MTRDQLLLFINRQINDGALNFVGTLTVEKASDIGFGELTSDSLDALQFAMVLEEETGIEIELEELNQCASLLDAVDLIASRTQ